MEQPGLRTGRRCRCSEWKEPGRPACPIDGMMDGKATGATGATGASDERGGAAWLVGDRRLQKATNRYGPLREGRVPCNWRGGRGSGGRTVETAANAKTSPEPGHVDCGAWSRDCWLARANLPQAVRSTERTLY